MFRTNFLLSLTRLSESNFLEFVPKKHITLLEAVTLSKISPKYFTKVLTSSQHLNSLL